MSDLEAGNLAGDVWHVQLANGELHRMTLEQLDDAFQGGLVNERTYVRQDGADAWAMLGAIAGVEADAPPAPLPAPVASVSGARPSIAPHSTAPMAADIDDLDDAQFAPRGRGKLLAFTGLLLLAGAAFGFTRFSSPGGLAVEASGGAAGAPLSETVTTASAGSGADAIRPVSDLNATPSSDGRLTDEQRRALLDADKSRAAKHKATVAPDRPRRRAPQKRGAPVFHTSGDEHDPLNAKL